MYRYANLLVVGLLVPQTKTAFGWQTESRCVRATIAGSHEVISNLNDTAPA